ncbi:MAG: hypothetical protein H7301_03860 [Cryobacterium sp.]|nr:hypothetical protein [Oligoflexia bacterium]
MNSGSHKTNICLLLFFTAAFLLHSPSAGAKQKKGVSRKAHPVLRAKNQRPIQARSPASAIAGKGAIDGEQPLKIQGQSRNLNMMLMLKGEKERVEFGESRHDYRMEVLGTQY